jgi:U6 snRNA-associated Sm-like protein LSm6
VFEYRGILVCVDGYLNTALDQTEEYENGIFKAKRGSCFIDGNKVLQLEKDYT